MTSTHRLLLLPALAAGLLATPLLAIAQDAHCKFSEPRTLKLDLAGAKSVVFQVGSNDLKVRASVGTDSALAGRACASSQDLLKNLTLTQKRVGDKLVVNLAQDRPLKITFGSSYSYLEVTGTVPNDLLVQLDVDSGDATLSGVSVASADVGSGDVTLRDIAGPVTAKIGSGDLKLDGAGTFKLLGIGSGDLEASRIKGKVEIGSVGSGDARLRDIGSLDVTSLGSGDIDVSGVDGSVVVGSIGSGDLTVRAVRGGLTVHRIGSGDIDQRDVTGAVSLPKKD